MERYQPRKPKPLYQAPMAMKTKTENLNALLKIEVAFKRVEAAQEELTQATAALLKTVKRAPEVVKTDFHKFYDGGGCSLREYRIWLCNSGRTYTPVRKRKTLRLVANNPPPPMQLRLPRGPKVAY